MAEVTRHDAEKEAAAERKRKAEEVLAKHLPGYKPKTIDKPVQHESPGGLRFEEKTGRSLPTFLPPSQSSVEKKPPKPTPMPPAVDKRSQVALMKLRSKAVPLITGSSSVAGDDKLFFTWDWRDGDRQGKGGEVWIAKVRSHLALRINATRGKVLMIGDRRRTHHRRHGFKS